MRGLKYSEKFELVFMVVEIQGNIFLNSTSDEELRASSQITNQTNIALVAFEKYCKHYKNLKIISWHTEVLQSPRGSLFQ